MKRRLTVLGSMALDMALLSLILQSAENPLAINMELKRRGLASLSADGTWWAATSQGHAKANDLFALYPECEPTS